MKESINSRPEEYRPKSKRRLLAVLFATVCLAALATLAAIFVFRPSAPERPPLSGLGTLIVCIDAGHGGTQPGALSVDGSRMEKDDNLALALAVRDILELEEDIEVIMTRETDTALELDERCQIANDCNAALFVSLHRNSGGGIGVEVWVASGAGSIDKALGLAILDRIAAAGVNQNRGLRKGTAANPDTDYAVIRGTDMPACIVEVGFIDSDSDNDVFDTNMAAYAAAIAEGIVSLKK